MSEVTLKGKPVHLMGRFVKQGELAPDFELVDQHLKTVTLSSLGKKKKLLNIVVSLDTPVCALSAGTFDQQLRAIDQLVVVNISMDLPFAADRFCKGGGHDHVIALSTFRSSFAEDYGVKIIDGPLAGLCARAVIVLGEDNRVLYSQLVPEITQEPDYPAAAHALTSSA